MDQAIVFVTHETDEEWCARMEGVETKEDLPSVRKRKEEKRFRQYIVVVRHNKDISFQEME